jgi:ankyrin repeat protein
MSDFLSQQPVETAETREKRMEKLLSDPRIDHILENDPSFDWCRRQNIGLFSRRVERYVTALHSEEVSAEQKSSVTKVIHALLGTDKETDITVAFLEENIQKKYGSGAEDPFDAFQRAMSAVKHPFHYPHVLSSSSNKKPEKLLEKVLGWAAENGRLDIMDILLSAEINPNTLGLGNPYRQDGPILMQAMREGRKDSMALLLAAGANPNLGDRSNITSVMVAAGKGEYDFVELLANAGADLNFVSNGYDDNLLYEDEENEVFETTALTEAVKGGHKEIVDFLIERGAKVRQIDLLMAFDLNHPDILGSLFGADTSPDSQIDEQVTNYLTNYLKDIPEKLESIKRFAAIGMLPLENVGQVAAIKDLAEQICQTNSNFSSLLPGQNMGGHTL